MNGLHNIAMISRLRQMSEPMLRWQVETEKSQTALEKDFLFNEKDTVNTKQSPTQHTLCFPP